MSEGTSTPEPSRVHLLPAPPSGMCVCCGVQPSPDRFCDLTMVDVGVAKFQICHDCALELVEALLGRYYALWGLTLADGTAILSEVQGIRDEIQALRDLLREHPAGPGEELPPSVEDALGGLGT